MSMLVKDNRKKILIYSITIPTSLAVIAGVTVGGYFVSYNSNPYLNYAKAPVNTSVDAYKAVYYSYLINNSNLLVLPGFSLAESMTSALHESKYNDAAFLLIDSEYYEDSTSQVAGASFRSDQGSFVTGIAIAQYLNEHKDYFTKYDRGGKKLTWATYGGNSFSSVSSFMVGVQLGIAWFNTYIATKPGLDYLPVEQVFLGRNQGDNYSMAFGPNDGDTIIDRFLNTPTTVDCLIPVAGPQAVSAATKIVAKKMRTIVVGVDSEIENDKIIKTKKLPNGTGRPKFDQVVPFSSFKNVGLMTYDILKNLQEGRSYENSVNNIGGLGYQSLGTLNNNCVGVSGLGKEYFVKAMNHYFDKTDSIINDYQTAVNKLCNIELFKKLNTNDYRNFVIGTSGGKSTMIDIAKYEQLIKQPLEGWQGYPALPNEGFTLKAMPEKLPDNLTHYFTQEDWDYKRNAPARVQKQLNDKLSSFAERVKLTLSTPTSVLLDASFSQSCYDGIAAFYNSNNTKLPFTDTTKPLVDLINQISQSNPSPSTISLLTPFRKRIKEQ